MSENIDKSTGIELPDDPKIEELLGKFQPSPSSRFRNMMQSAPWESQGSAKRLIFQRKKHRSTKLIWGIACGLLLVLILGIAFVPPIQVIARQIMYSFIPAPSNQIEVQVTVPSPEDLYHYSNPENFPLTIDEAQTQANFLIKQLSQVPEGMRLIGARFDQTYGAVIILYQGDSTQLYLTQRQIGKGQDVFSIGESSSVRFVRIGDSKAELVTGGWKAISTQPTDGIGSTSNSVNITAAWDNNLPQTTLRWQKDGFAYELRSVGENRPSEDELIGIANGLK
jgi:hypothetical protein